MSDIINVIYISSLWQSNCENNDHPNSFELNLN